MYLVKAKIQVDGALGIGKQTSSFLGLILALWRPLTKILFRNANGPHRLIHLDVWFPVGRLFGED